MTYELCYLPPCRPIPVSTCDHHCLIVVVVVHGQGVPGRLDPGLLCGLCHIAGRSVPLPVTSDNIANLSVQETVG